MSTLVVGLNARDAHAGFVRELVAALRDYPGDSPVRVEVEVSDGSTATLELGAGFSCDASSPELRARVERLVGAAGLFSVLP